MLRRHNPEEAGTGSWRDTVVDNGKSVDNLGKK